mmetsp:Transcript_3588/g.3939  ORF Transcript_3588/g.3939 Transcript_3588/m.3939 type:complete len:518 (-) Transcript_3588:157-1710(-)
MLGSLFAFDLWLLIKIPVLLTLLMILYLFYIFGYRVSSKRKRFEAQNLPIVKILSWNFAKEAKALLDKYSDFLFPVRDAIKKHPDAKALVLQFGPIIAVNLIDPDYIKEYNNRLLEDYERFAGTKILDTVAKNGIFALAGDNWKLHRKILADSFRFDLFEKNIVENHNAAIEYFRDLPANELQEFQPREHLKRIFSAITGQNFFGGNVDKRMIGDKSALACVYDVVNMMFKMNQSPMTLIFGPDSFKYGILPSHRRYTAACKKVRNFLIQLIQEKRKELEADPSQKGKNIIEGMLEAQKQFPDRADILDDESIAGEFVTLLIAGTDTTSTVLTITLYLLSQYPDLVDDLRKEIQQAIPDGKIKTISQLNNLELLHSTLKEVMRLYPPASFTLRTARHDTQVLDIKIKKGDCVGFGINANGCNPKYWENPEKFEPRRFMKGALPSNHEPFAFLAFSAGMRNCVGQHFAMIQAKLVLSTFLTMFDFKLVPDYKFAMTFSLTYEPLNPVKLILSKRSTSN